MKKALDFHEEMIAEVESVCREELWRWLWYWLLSELEKEGGQDLISTV